jgi:hypothetical protein
LSVTHIRAVVAYAKAHPDASLEEIHCAPHIVELNDRLQARLALIEGQAIALQEEVSRETFPRAWRPSLFGVRAPDPDAAKRRQYADGSRAFHLIRDLGLVEQAFTNPTAITDVLLRKHGEVVVCAPGAGQAQQDQIRRNVSSLLAHNPHRNEITIRFEFSSSPSS